MTDKLKCTECGKRFNPPAYISHYRTDHDNPPGYLCSYQCYLKHIEFEKPSEEQKRELKEEAAAKQAMFDRMRDEQNS